MKRPHYLFAGAAASLLAVAPMVYFVGFLAGRWVPKGIDSGDPGAPSSALALDLALLASFALVHSVLARPAWSARLLAWLPVALRRSFFSCVAGLQIILLMAAWRPLDAPVWEIRSALVRGAIWAAFVLGWIVVVSALCAIDSLHLFGARAAWDAAVGRARAEPAFVPRGVYRWIRHPLYSGTILAMFAAPTMSAGHLLLAVVFSAYTLLGARFEERDLARRDPAYLAYRDRVPAYLPSLRFRRIRGSGA